MFTTLFIPLSGRKKCWKCLSRFLSHQKINKTQFKLFLLDTSSDDSFNSLVANWVQSCDYPNVVLERKLFTERRRLAELKRVDHVEEVNNVMCEIYNYAKTVIEGELLFIIEDDVIPPTDIFDRLVPNMKEGVLCVSGAYTMKKRRYQWLAWRGINENILEHRGSGVEIVEATGFGCLLIFAKDYIQSEITCTKYENENGLPWGFDLEFFSKQTKKILIDWEAFCEHLEESTLSNLILLI